MAAGGIRIDLELAAQRIAGGAESTADHSVLEAHAGGDVKAFAPIRLGQAPQRSPAELRLRGEAREASDEVARALVDRPGAELLLGRGHLAAKLNGEQGLVFAQAPFLSDQDIEAAVAAIQTDNSKQ